MPDHGGRDRLSVDEIFKTFEANRDNDDDFTANARVPIPRKPNRDDALIAPPEPDEDKRDS
jgi:hypothetical protein